MLVVAATTFNGSRVIATASTFVGRNAAPLVSCDSSSDADIHPRRLKSSVPTVSAHDSTSSEGLGGESNGNGEGLGVGAGVGAAPSLNATIHPDE